VLETSAVTRNLFSTFASIFSLSQEKNIGEDLLWCAIAIKKEKKTRGFPGGKTPRPTNDLYTGTYGL